MKALKAWLPIVVVIGIALLWVDIHFNANIFSLLPANSSTAQGLQRYESEFKSSQALLIAVQGESAEQTKTGAQALASTLRQQKFAHEIFWQNPFTPGSPAFADLLAYLWLNEAPEAFNAMYKRFDENMLPEHLNTVFERMATSFNAADIGRLSIDPFELIAVTHSLGFSASRDPFVSDDGLLRVIYIPYPDEDPDYSAYKRWLDDFYSIVAAAKNSGDIDPALSIRVTGQPVLSTEFGTRMMQDLVQAAIGTLTVVLLLFWFAYRRIAPLLWLALLMVSTLAVTVITGAWLFDSLNVISLGFAAILLGLTVDYGLIVYQEYRVNPGQGIKPLQKVLAPSILWAALTTAGAFFMVARSSLPGLTQLGALVAIGILIVAVFVLTAYLRSIHSSVPEKLEHNFAGGSFLKLSKIPSRGLTLVGAVLSVLVLCVARPTIESDAEALEFQNVEAREVKREIEAKITGAESNLWVLISAENEQQLAERSSQAAILIDTFQKQHPDLRVNLPKALWPRPDTQHSNLKKASGLAARQKAIEEQAFANGLDQDSLELMRAVFARWTQYAQEGIDQQNHQDQNLDQNQHKAIWPQTLGLQWLFKQFTVVKSEEVLGLGQLFADSSIPANEIVALAQQVNQIDGVQLLGWSLLANDLVGTMLVDAKNVVLPMVIALVLFLGLAFRDLRDIGLSFLTLAFSLCALVALMVVFGWSWNLMNMTALPLLLGAGVDYSIHIQLALKRHRGDLDKVYKSVGMAILLCGASTTAAFVSLSFASNPGIASLGKIAAVGILVMCVTSVFLLPGWWLALRRSTLNKEDVNLDK